MRNNKKLIYGLGALLILSASISVYSLLQSSTTSNQINGNATQMETNYDYKATITPNILYPDGGTVEAGNTIFKKITTSIPVNMKSIIHSEKAVMAKGTHSVQLVIKAGDIWERAFPLEQQQAFEQTGSELAVIDQTYNIDLEKIQNFITKVEEETGIRPAQYTLEVVPNIQGTIHYAGEEKNFKMQDALVFQYSHEEIILASGKTFTSATPFTSIQVTTSSFHLFGIALPLKPVRIISLLLSVLFLTTFIFSYKKSAMNRESSAPSQVEKINNKYGSRIIPVSQKINIAQKSIFTLDSFKSVIKIADEKELPIFFYNDHHDGSGIYLLVDGDYIYSYEANKTEFVTVKNEAGSEQVYAGR